jgi:hypothetical protein
MAVIMAVVLFLVGTLGTAVSRLLTDEFKAWIPWIIQRVIRRAVVRLPASQRERFEEEWQSHVNEVPGDVGKLTVALGFLTAARRITTNPSPAPLTVKRFFDCSVSIILLLWMGPAMLVISLALLVSTGRVLTAGDQVVNGRKFKRLQFHTAGRLGRFLFRTGFDELPDLINVIRGDMGLTAVRFWWRR